MTSQAKLTIRPLPHLDFVLGFPGIPPSTQASRNAAHIAGSIEVRLGSKGLKAKWLRIELRKLENAGGGEKWGELIGRGPIDVWTARPGAGSGDREVDSEGSNWETLQTADFPFRIVIPEGLPPTCRLDKQCGISYEVVASLCVKIPKGLFRKEETTSVIQSMHPIVIEKHELHSTWPIYNQPDLHAGENGLLRAKIRRDRHAYAPGDRAKVTIIVGSNRVEPAKIKSVAFSIKETITFHGVKSGRMSLTSSNANESKPASQHVETLAQKSKLVGKKLYKGDSFTYELECLIPKSHALMTISTAKHIEISYTMRVYVDISKAPIIIDHIPMVMTTFSRNQSTELMRKIGFVEGLSERDMTIEGDDDNSPQVTSRRSSTRPIVNRSMSVGTRRSSNSSGYDAYNAYNANLRRRDTVMTNISGPGMAGRGVPGQLFAYGSHDPSYMDDSAAPPRMAFAGPSSVYEGAEGALTPQERAAVTHYHTATPQSAIALGVDYSSIATVSGLEGPPVLPRPHFESIPEEARGEVQRHLQMHRQSQIGIPRSQQRDAEEEKERLYQRAREQAERNQRRADERRAQAMASASLPPSLINSRSGTPAQADGSSAYPPQRAGSAAPLTSVEQEKRMLYERARREAEAYQRGYTHGATFPDEQDGDSRRGTPMQTFQQDKRSSPDQIQQNVNTPIASQHHQERRRDSDVYWLDSPVMDQQAAQTAKRASMQPASPSAAPVIAAPVATRSYLSAEEEKKRLYEAAKAETESRLQEQQGPAASGSSSRVAAAAPASTSAPVQESNAASALSEKAQLARYQAAMDAVHQQQAQDGQGIPGAFPASSAQSHPESSGQSRPQSQTHSNPSAHTAATTPSPAPAQSEKEQLRLYHEARDRQAEVENASLRPGSSSLNPYRHSMGPSPTMASPRPTYAPNYQNSVHSGWQQRTSPLPQGRFPSVAEDAIAMKHRSLSNTLPTPPSNKIASPSLPNVRVLSLGENVRGGTPTILEGPWAPKVASSSWLDRHDLRNDTSANSAPPPLPPKTPLATSARR